MSVGKTFTAVDCIRKALLNYDLMIISIHTDLTRVQSTLARYKGYRSKRYKSIYEANYWEEKRLLRYLDALREGQANCKAKIDELLELFYSNPAHRKIWVLYFIENKTDTEIANITLYEPHYIRKIITNFRKDLVDLGFKTLEQEK